MTHYVVRAYIARSYKKVAGRKEKGHDGSRVEQWEPEITADTADEEIEEIAEAMEAEARTQGLTFELVRDFLVQLLENKREKTAEDE